MRARRTPRAGRRGRRGARLRAYLRHDEGQVGGQVAERDAAERHGRGRLDLLAAARQRVG